MDIECPNEGYRIKVTAPDSGNCEFDLGKKRRSTVFSHPGAIDCTMYPMRIEYLYIIQ